MASDAPVSTTGTPASPGVLEEAQVRAMFDRIAGLYDRMNSVMTAGLHHTWRRRAADLTQLGPGGRALDVATGTGDLALELAERVGPLGEVVASDFSDGMLDLARVKASAVGATNVRFENANALALPYRDDEFDAATVGFGARNFSDLSAGLREMVRVVRPGGRVVVLEITTPSRPPLSTFFELWFDRIVPSIGRLAGDPAAYSYLPASVRRFPGPEALAGVLYEAGLCDIRYVLTAGGIIALHSGTVESARGGADSSGAVKADTSGSSPPGAAPAETERGELPRAGDSA
jgi:demethylmenaquinone methyltransferase/2-methoxy-6-polyprenyl-1,4-benzoquinol methylase